MGGASRWWLHPFAERAGGRPCGAGQSPGAGAGFGRGTGGIGGGDRRGWVHAPSLRAVVAECRTGGAAVKLVLHQAIIWCRRAVVSQAGRALSHFYLLRAALAQLPPPRLCRRPSGLPGEVWPASDALEDWGLLPEAPRLGRRDAAGVAAGRGQGHGAAGDLCAAGRRLCRAICRGGGDQPAFAAFCLWRAVAQHGVARGLRCGGR